MLIVRPVLGEMQQVDAQQVSSGYGGRPLPALGENASISSKARPMALLSSSVIKALVPDLFAFAGVLSVGKTHPGHSVGLMLRDCGGVI